MSGAAGRRVVAGYDGSDSGAAALRWAATRALRDRLPLEVVAAARVWPYDARGDAPTDLDRLRELVDAQVRSLREDHADLDVTSHVVAATPSALLLERSAEAGLLVVGARGYGGFPDLRLGSVGAQVAAHARCPVVVVREPAGTGVVVGVDGSPASERAVGFAYAEAAAAGEPLTAVHAWLPSYAGLADVPLSRDVTDLDEEETALLGERLAGWGERYPQVEVRRLVRAEHPVAALLELGAGARLLVVGSHGRGGLRSVLLGSVSRAVLHDAPCSVAVVRDGERPGTAQP